MGTSTALAGCLCHSSVDTIAHPPTHTEGRECPKIWDSVARERCPRARQCYHPTERARDEWGWGLARSQALTEASVQPSPGRGLSPGKRSNQPFAMVVRGWFPRWWWRVTPGLKREGVLEAGALVRVRHRSPESGNGNPPSGQPRAADSDASPAARCPSHRLNSSSFSPWPGPFSFGPGAPHTITTPPLPSAAG